ncbi:MAG: hypothetical protein RL669_1198, partial [Pseudomonadota bacterium]
KLVTYAEVGLLSGASASSLPRLAADPEPDSKP